LLAISLAREDTIHRPEQPIWSFFVFLRSSNKNN
jgi:hypothetical protein